MVLEISLIINAVGILLSIGLLVYSLLLIRVFRGLDRPWLYIAIGSLCLTMGQFSFFAERNLNIPTALAGCIFSLIAGLFLLGGLHSEYKIWKKLMKKQSD